MTLRVWHPDCWMLELSERHPEICVASRGVSARGHTVHTDACIRASHHDALRDALEDPVPSDVWREVLHVGHAQAEVYSNYPAYRSIYEATLETGFVVVGPVLHAGGYERWEVLADSATLHQGVAALREVGEVRIERVADTRPPVAHEAYAGLLDRLGEQLSERQFDILGRAVANGYYDWPRGKNVKRLAAELGISAPTCLEHLRRAESRIVPAVLEELVRLRRDFRPR